MKPLFREPLELIRALFHPKSPLVTQVQDSNRGKEWMEFSPKVHQHITDYTVKQYGDFPNDPITDFSIKDYKTNMLRYCNRIGTGARGKDEAMRDCLKMAHYACMLYNKYERTYGKQPKVRPMRLE